LILPHSGHLAQCARGLEEVLAQELRGLGAREVEPVAGGALFEADPALARRAAFWLRSAMRVLEPVVSGRVRTPDELYELASRAPWEELIGARHTFAVRASVAGRTTESGSGRRDRHRPDEDQRQAGRRQGGRRHGGRPGRGRGDSARSGAVGTPALSGSHFAALRIKDAVVDRIRDRRGLRPDVDRHDPDVPLRLVVRGETAHLFRDLAGESLHRRGYRPIQVRSPLAEATAAGLLLLTGWDRSSPLLDPMCGSGTFVIEAAALATDRAPGIARELAAERFPDADAALWRRLREEAADRFRPSLSFTLLGVDRHPGAVGIATRSARAADLAAVTRFEVADAALFEPPERPAVVVANPPWGERLGEGDDLVASWRALGTLLRRCPGASAWVLSGSAELTRHLGLRASRRWPIRIGRFDARWLHYEMRS
jgi:putative N6-adenine-specific DNA methylase